MLNQAVIVGEIESITTPLIDPEEDVIIHIKVIGSFKTRKGVYHQDIIPINIPPELRMNFDLIELKVGGLVGIKGTIRVRDNHISILAERLSFLTLKGSDDDATPSGENHA